MPVLEEQIRARRDTDAAGGSTATGPQRGDFGVVQDGRPVRAFASRGQQRAAALAMRFGLAALAQAPREGRPVFLLDDVLSELDARSGARVFKACRSVAQAVLTSADLEDVPEETWREATLREVRDGQVI